MSEVRQGVLWAETGHPPPKLKGLYASSPGSGPAGETCGSCAHRVRKPGGYKKCILVRAHWTNGAGTDAKSKAPACRHWEAI